MHADARRLIETYQWRSAAVAERVRSTAARLMIACCNAPREVLARCKHAPCPAVFTRRNASVTAATQAASVHSATLSAA